MGVAEAHPRGARSSKQRWSNWKWSKIPRNALWKMEIGWNLYESLLRSKWPIVATPFEVAFRKWRWMTRRRMCLAVAFHCCQDGVQQQDSSFCPMSKCQISVTCDQGWSRDWLSFNVWFGHMAMICSTTESAVQSRPPATASASPRLSPWIMLQAEQNGTKMAWCKLVNYMDIPNRAVNWGCGDFERKAETRCHPRPVRLLKIYW